MVAACGAGALAPFADQDGGPDGGGEVVRAAEGNGDLAVVERYDIGRYDGMGETELKVQLVARDIELALNAERILNLEQHNENLKRRLAAARDRTVHAKHQAFDIVCAMRARLPGTHKVSDYGGFNMALHRSKVGHVNRSAVVAMMAGADCQGSVRSGHVVEKYE